MMPVKRLLILMTLFLSVTIVKAQQETADIGLYVGNGYSFGEVSSFSLKTPTVGAYYRFNANSRFSIRVGGNYGKISGSSEVDGSTRMFSKSMFSGSLLIEINYLDFILGVKKKSFSPYIVLGGNLLNIPDNGGKYHSSFGLPVGTGIKYGLNDKVGIGAEMMFIKSFVDFVDNIDQPYKLIGMDDVNDIFHNNDWVNYFGVSIWYKFYMGSKDCPTYESKY